MGYTHYWHQKADFTLSQWNHLCAAAQDAIAKVDNGGCQFEFDDNAPAQIDRDTIRFNGIEADGHETFILNRKRRELEPWAKEIGIRRGSDFCKTARKPYDRAIVEILNEAKTIAPTRISLDTDGDMFCDGKYIKILSEHALDSDD